MDFNEQSIKLDLAQQIDKMKDSTSRLTGPELISAHNVISSISERPFEFKIAEFKIAYPYQAEIAGPKDEMSGTMVGEKVIFEPLPSTTGFRFAHQPSQSASATITCPQCGHAVTVKLSCE